MATRKTPSKKIIMKKGSDYSQVKTLDPKDADTKYFGEEPMFAVQPDEDQRRLALMRSFTWYGRFYGKKDAKEFLVQYLEMRQRSHDAKIMRKVEEKECINTLCWLARMELRGLELSETESNTLQNEINRLIESVNKPEIIEATKTGAPLTPANPVTNLPSTTGVKVFNKPSAPIFALSKSRFIILSFNKPNEPLNLSIGVPSNVLFLS